MPAPKSPFPGLDPYVQRFWRDVHAGMIVYSRGQLGPKLPGDLRARIEERLVFEQPLRDAEWREVVPDLYLVEREKGERWRGIREDEGGDAAVAAPMTFRAMRQPLRETYLEIREPGTGGRVVAIVEFLSPTNKTPGDGMTKYLAKQRFCREAEVSLVEIDLIRGGRHVLSLPEEFVPANMKDWPRVCAFAGWDVETLKFYPVSLRERMPVIAVPLRKDDPPIALDLQAVFDRCWEVGEYGLDINYGAEPAPPFAPDDAGWAEAWLREKGVRA